MTAKSMCYHLKTVTERFMIACKDCATAAYTAML